MLGGPCQAYFTPQRSAARNAALLSPTSMACWDQKASGWRATRRSTTARTPDCASRARSCGPIRAFTAGREVRGGTRQVLLR